jgi:hypothetical protein
VCVRLVGGEFCLGGFVCAIRTRARGGTSDLWNAVLLRVPFSEFSCFQFPQKASVPDLEHFFTGQLAKQGSRLPFGSSKEPTFCKLGFGIDPFCHSSLSQERLRQCDKIGLGLLIPSYHGARMLVEPPYMTSPTQFSVGLFMVFCQQIPLTLIPDWES